MLRTACYVVVAAVVVFCGCGDDGRAARRNDAIDVAGLWVEVVVDGPAAQLLIDTETSKNDVRAVLRRDVDDDALADEEAALVARLSDANDRLAVRSALEIGAGVDAIRDEIDGGENVSFDDGASTSVRIVSVAFAADSDRESDSDSDSDVRVASQRWGLALDGDGDELRGALFVTTLEQRARPDDSNGTFRAARRFERSIVFRRQ